MAITPTTITCWRTSDRLSPVRKRSLCEVKNAHVARRASNGPNVANGGSLSFQLFIDATLFVAETQLHAGLYVFALDAFHRLARDQIHRRLMKPARLLSGPDKVQLGRNAERRHLQ